MTGLKKSRNDLQKVNEEAGNSFARFFLLIDLTCLSDTLECVQSQTDTTRLIHPRTGASSMTTQAPRKQETLSRQFFLRGVEWHSFPAYGCWASIWDGELIVAPACAQTGEPVVGDACHVEHTMLSEEDGDVANLMFDTIKVFNAEQRFVG